MTLDLTLLLVLQTLIMHQPVSNSRSALKTTQQKLVLTTCFWFSPSWSILLFLNKNLLCNLYRLHQCCGWKIRLWPDFLILVLDQVLQFHNWVFPVKNLPEQNNVESLLFSTGFLPKTVVCSMKTIRPKKYLWKWSRVLLDVTALKKKRGDAPGYVWAQQLHPQDLICRAVSWKD